LRIFTAFDEIKIYTEGIIAFSRFFLLFTEKRTGIVLLAVLFF